MTHMKEAKQPGGLDATPATPAPVPTRIDHLYALVAYAPDEAEHVRASRPHASSERSEREAAR